MSCFIKGCVLFSSWVPCLLNFVLLFWSTYLTGGVCGNFRECRAQSHPTSQIGLISKTTSCLWLWLCFLGPSILPGRTCSQWVSVNSAVGGADPQRWANTEEMGDFLHNEWEVIKKGWEYTRSIMNLENGWLIVIAFCEQTSQWQLTKTCNNM